MNKYVFLNCILLYSYFCIHLSLMFCLVRFWLSLLSSCSSFPNTSSQFYSSAEGLLGYLLARIEQQLIIGLLFGKLHSLVSGQRVLHQLHTDFWKAPGVIFCWRAPGKAEFNSGEKSHSSGSESPGQLSD